MRPYMQDAFVFQDAALHEGTLSLRAMGRNSMPCAAGAKKIPSRWLLAFGGGGVKHSPRHDGLPIAAFRFPIVLVAIHESSEQVTPTR